VVAAEWDTSSIVAVLIVTLPLPCMQMEPDSQKPSDRVLEYAGPAARRRAVGKCMAALVYAVFAIGGGLLFAYGALTKYLHDDSNAAVRSAIFSGLLLSSGFGFGYAALREWRADR